MIRVFDTSALIYDPRLITDGYPGDDIIIPMTSLREIDRIKSEREHPGPSAREVIRSIDEIRNSGEGDIAQGITRAVGGTLRVELNHISDTSVIPEHAVVSSNDDKIILVTLNLDKETDEEVVLVTQDGSMSIIAESWGVTAVRHELVGSDDKLPKGIVHVTPQSTEIEDLHSYEENCTIPDDIPANTGVVISSGSSSALSIADGEGFAYKVDQRINMNGIAPRGAEQIVAANLLMGRTAHDSDTEFLGSLSGRAGAGKTLLALSAGVSRTMKGEYNDVIIFRPTEPVGRDLGYLPGNLDEKMAPWEAAINDVLEAMSYNPSSVAGRTQGNTDHIRDLISIEPSTYVRGRTLRNKWIIIEEAQNYEPVVLRTLLSRAGEGSAVVLTWDPSQVDNEYLRRNRADAPMSVMKDLLGDPMVWHIELKNPERGGVSAIID